VDHYSDQTDAVEIAQIRTWVKWRDLPKLRQAAAASRWEVRKAALMGLCEIDCDDADRLLIEALSDRAGGVRRFAAAHLGQRKGRAVPQLLTALADPRLGPRCAAILAASTDGRRALRQLPDRGIPLLAQATRLGEISVHHLTNICNTLVVYLEPEAGDVIAALLAHTSPRVRDKAGRCLMARRDARAVPWMVDPARAGWWPGLEDIAWLGELGDPAAMPWLRRLASPWRLLTVAPPARAAAREALARIEEALRHVPDGAISRAAPPMGQPTAAALSLWESVDEDDD
jgi:HEAT repeat protein